MHQGERPHPAYHFLFVLFLLMLFVLFGSTGNFWGGIRMRQNRLRAFSLPSARDRSQSVDRTIDRPFHPTRVEGRYSGTVGALWSDVVRSERHGDPQG